MADRHEPGSWWCYRPATISYFPKETTPVSTPITVTIEREEPEPTPIKKVIVELSEADARNLRRLIGSQSRAAITERGFDLTAVATIESTVNRLYTALLSLQ